MKKLYYSCSVKATHDLDEVLTYTNRYYGEEKVLEIANSLTAFLKDLMVNPEMGRPRFELAEDLRSIPWLKFIIYYQVLVHEISVV